ncbi:hypothetical protein KC853_01635 [Candidatus Saccharibacteria bacterium]|nr:hypothetical protein [Candidatus Saccharibacteria bacterium]MCB9834804.1 hypothetical protein [Candidatus Nomurabacteria bacterium]
MSEIVTHELREYRKDPYATRQDLLNRLVRLVVSVEQSQLPPDIEIIPVGENNDAFDVYFVDDNKKLRLAKTEPNGDSWDGYMQNTGYIGPGQHQRLGIKEFEWVFSELK